MGKLILVAGLHLAVLAGLAACATPEELHAEDEARCAGYGFQRGTIEFANCMQRESILRRYAPIYGPPPFGFGWYDGQMWYPGP
jgi:hypothetical protein